MIVCHCRKITHRDLHRCVDAGAHTEAEIERMCGAGGACGGCRRSIREVLDERVPSREIVFLPLSPMR
ncbi:MAG: (2Fe-2S)-binding protein [Myxococcales bacterium]|nr:(2Fe-2S)-binding protein [Myxococcales bacterium]